MLHSSKFRKSSVRLAAISALLFGASASAAAATVTSSPTSVSAGSALSVSWDRQGTPASTDWIGLYRVGDANTGTRQWWSYVPAATGTANLNAPLTTGTYEFRYFSANTYTLLATSAPVTVTASTAVITLTPTPTTVNAGAALSIAWSMTGRTPTSTDWIGLYRVGDPSTGTRQWYAYAGTASGSRSLTAPNTTGSYEFRFFAQNSYTLLATSATVTVGGGATLPTATLSANPPAIGAGQSSTLTWSSTNATGCTASGGWTGAKATSGTQSVSPLLTTVYSLTCAGPGGTSPVQSVTVTISGVGGGSSVTPSATAVDSGSPMSVSFVREGAPAATDWIGLFRVGDPNNGTRHWWAYAGTATGTRNLSAPLTGGTFEFRFFAQNTYTLLARSAPVTVTVVPVNITFTPTPTSVTAGGALSIAWTMSGRTPTSTDWIGLFRVGDPNTGQRLWWAYTGGTASGSRNTTAPAVNGNYEFRLFAQNTYTLLATSATVTVGGGAPVPTATLSANPLGIVTGQSSTLTWSSTNATGCTATGGWTGAKASSGTQVVSPTVTTTYNLTCAGTGGTSPVQSVTVTVTAGAATFTLTPSPLSVIAGQPLNIAWSMSGRTPVSTDWIGLFRVGDPDNGTRHWWEYINAVASGSKTLTVPLTISGSFEFRLFAQNSLTLLATSAPVTVSPPVPTATLTASPATITIGLSSTLTWSSTHATGCTATDGWTGAKAANGTQTVSPTTTTTYSISCTGPGGTSPVQSVTVTVVQNLTPVHNFTTGTEVYNYVNLAWGRYFRASTSAWIQTFGMDFGACPLLDARRVTNNLQIATDLDALLQRGVQGVRWWVIPDGRNLIFNGARTATGRGAGFTADLHRAMDLLDARNMGVIFTLIDGNTWFKPEGTFQGAMFGHTQSITNATKRQALYTTVIIPMLQDIAAWAAAHPSRRFPVTAIDLINEPFFGVNGQTGATTADIQAYVREATVLVHQYLPGIPVTVGEARANLLPTTWTDAALGVAAGNGLDIYSFHHFGPEPLEGAGSIRSQLGTSLTGKRIYLQEFPTKNPPLGTPTAYLAAIGGTRNNQTSLGWLSGAFPWSFTAQGDAWTADDPLPMLSDLVIWYAMSFNQPDLAIGPVTLPNLQNGNTPQFAIPVANLGGAPSVASRYEMLIDNVLHHAVILPALAPGEFRTVTAPAWTAVTGGHNLWAKSDTLSQVNEPNEFNNERVIPFTVFSGPLPDLVVTGVTMPTQVLPGQVVTFTVHVQNIGLSSAASNRLEGWLDGVMLGAVTVPTLAAGQSTSLVLPTWTATLGPHVLWAAADIFQVIPELNEDNNERNTSFNVH